LDVVAFFSHSFEQTIPNEQSWRFLIFYGIERAMARYVTTQDRTVRTRWASFLEPLVGEERPVTAGTLAKAISARRPEARRGDGTWQVWDWLAGERTVTPELAFEAGEALRTCGIGWSTGIGALWAAGHIGDYARSVTNLVQDYPTFPDLAVVIGTLAPIFASPDLLLHLRVDSELIDEGRRLLTAFGSHIAVGWVHPGFGPGNPAWRKLRRPLPGDELLRHAADLGDAQNIAIAIRERMVMTLVVEWGLNAGSAPRRDGHLIILAGLLAAHSLRLLESATARSGRGSPAQADRMITRLLTAVDRRPLQPEPRTSSPRTRRKKP
jgi:hypothetical protein